MNAQKLAPRGIEPELPNMPIFDMSFAAWCEFYAQEIREYLFQRFGRYLDTDEWLMRCQQFYDLQKIKDKTP